MKIISVFTLFFLSISLLEQNTSDTLNTTAITNVTIINTIGEPERGHMTVIIADGHILSIQKSYNRKIAKGVKVIDGTGKFLLPGLWDMHTHIGNKIFDKQSILKLFVVNGITGIRVMNGFPEHHLWRKEMESGILLAPQMVIASRYIGYYNYVSNESEGVSEVMKAKQEGADFIKVHDSISKPAYFAIISEAKQLGLLVEGHVPLSITAGEASNAGQKTIEHFTGLDIAANDSTIARSLLETFKKNKTWICPTLIMRHNYTTLTDTTLLHDPRLKYLKPSSVRWWLDMVLQSGKIPYQEWGKRKELIQKEDALVAKMHESGIGLLAGTDNGNPFCFPGSSLHEELELLVKAGLTPLEALRTATINPAKFLDKTDYFGTIATGNIADMILLCDNPLIDIRNTRKIYAVILKGRVIDRKTLDEMLVQVEKSTQE